MIISSLFFCWRLIGAPILLLIGCLTYNLVLVRRYIKLCRSSFSCCFLLARFDGSWWNNAGFWSTKKSYLYTVVSAISPVRPVRSVENPSTSSLRFTFRPFRRSWFGWPCLHPPRSPSLFPCRVSTFVPVLIPVPSPRVLVPSFSRLLFAKSLFFRFCVGSCAPGLLLSRLLPVLSGFCLGFCSSLLPPVSVPLVSLLLIVS